VVTRSLPETWAVARQYLEVWVELPQTKHQRGSPCKGCPMVADELLGGPAVNWGCPREAHVLDTGPLCDSGSTSTP
jgi:hypothetical protein